MPIKNLRTLRKRVGMTQRELSAKTRIERTRLSLFENGHLKPSPQEQAALEKALLAEFETARNSLEKLISTSGGDGPTAA